MKKPIKYKITTIMDETNCIMKSNYKKIITKNWIIAFELITNYYINKKIQLVLLSN